MQPQYLQRGLVIGTQAGTTAFVAPGVLEVGMARECIPIPESFQCPILCEAYV